MHNQIGGFGVVSHEMNGIIMLSVHAGVHHEDAGFYGCTFTGFEDHRTDSQFRRSAPLQNFDIRFLFETNDAIAGVGNCDLE
jgi:hypothetical protein